MAVSVGLFKKYTENRVRTWTVGAGVPEKTLVVDPTSKQVGVTLTASSGTTVSKTLPDGSTISKSIKGVGNATGATEVAVDGSWLFAVTGLAAGETTGTGTSGTPRGTAVYLADNGTLTTTKGTNTYVGIVDDGYIVGGVAPVQIGVSA